MANVFIWDTKQYTGHASIDTGKYYVSFHPNLTKLDPAKSHKDILTYLKNHKESLFKIADGVFPTFFTTKTEDQDDLYGYPVNTVAIDTLDTTLIDDYLKPGGGFYRDHPHYKLESCNCSTAVAALLFLGNHEYWRDKSFIGTAITKMRYLNQILYKDADRLTKDYHQRRYELIADQIEQQIPKALAVALRSKDPWARVLPEVFGALDFGRRAGIWTPGDVLHLATHIRDHKPQWI